MLPWQGMNCLSMSGLLFSSSRLADEEDEEDDISARDATAQRVERHRIVPLPTLLALPVLLVASVLYAVAERLSIYEGRSSVSTA